MAGQKIGPRINGKAAEARTKKWLGKVGSVTLPLLAGFSFTSVILVSDDTAHFLLPGLTILTLVVATLVLIAAVQCAYHAQIYFAKEDPDYKLAVQWYIGGHDGRTTSAFCVAIWSGTGCCSTASRHAG
jgi:hypothetical protein